MPVSIFHTFCKILDQEGQELRKSCQVYQWRHELSGKVRKFLARRFEFLKCRFPYFAVDKLTAEEANRTNVILVWTVLWRGAISRCDGMTAQVSKKSWLISTVSPSFK